MVERNYGIFNEKSRDLVVVADKTAFIVSFLCYISNSFVIILNLQ